MRNKTYKIISLMMVAFSLGFAVVFNFFSSASDYYAYAVSSTADQKGFVTDGLTYITDQINEDITIKTDKYTYGRFSMWTALYKYIVTESDNSNTCYYYALIESSIDSEGKVGSNRFFRNKVLEISLDFYSNSDNFAIVNYTPESSNSTTSSSVSLGINGSVSLDASGPSVTLGGSIAYEKTETYDTVNLVTHKYTLENNHKQLSFIFNFTNWKDGKMIAPNIGLVQERMAVIFAIYDYSEEDDYILSIVTTATIFKDAKWPLTNATLSDSVEHTYLND